ncbi:MAG: GTP-binding protein [Burkholderiales bacterium]|nr:GTP-binding protein [Burkholderiales bacterium]
MTPATARAPVSIITGYLGAGKTTLLNRLLRDPALADAAVIVNEFGEIALDHLLVAAPGETVVTLQSGCICCEMRGDLVGALADLHRRRREGTLPAFGRVLIETTGLADPVPILQTLLADRELAPVYRLDSVVTVVDGVHGEAQLDAAAEALKQAALADRVVVSKTDIAAAPALERLRERLARVNPGASIIAAANGGTPAAQIFGAGLDEAARGAGIARWLGVEHYGGAAGNHPPRGRHRHADPAIDAFCIYHDRPVTGHGLALWLGLLASLRGANLLRVKALLNVDGNPVAVHAVQTLIEEPVALERWPDAERRSRLVFITRGMARADIERTLPALGYSGAPAGAFDPDAYARFAALAGRFR